MREVGAVRLVAAIFGLLVVASGCTKQAAKSEPRSIVAHATTQTSISCQSCHAEIHAQWAQTDHALANRAIDPSQDQAAFTAAKIAANEKSRFQVAWQNGQPVMTESAGAASPLRHVPDLMLGNKPLRQPLVATGNGRWQPTELAFDPAHREWFNVFGAEERQPDEWGHWRGRGMNWNSMCAHCHMTGYQKNYSASTDSYASTWVEHGIGCIQCHGAMPADHQARRPGEKRNLSAPPPPPFAGDRQKMQQTCAPCHARNEMLTAEFQPGDRYADHYRLTLPVDAATFYPDGQQRDEDFNWTSVSLSRMGHAGVTCLDCHDPHTTKTILPVANNQLCLRCHQAPGVNKAPAIDPTAHSHHASNSTGNQCVSCHMPTTTYMQRAPRHDHGWIKPDPLLTKELGIPNACSRCHTKESTEWAIEKSTQWYGAKLESHQRARTRAVAAAQRQEPTAVRTLLDVLQREDIPAWRATLLELLVPFAATSSEAVAAARTALTAADPLERSAGVRLLATLPNGPEQVRPLLRDPVRLVRLDAAWALSATLAPDSPERRELDAYLALATDQPGGRMRLGQDLANRGRTAEALPEVQKAVDWDPYSPGIRDALGMVLSAAGKPREAAAAFFRAAQLQPTDGQSAYRAALAFAEAGQLADAEVALRLAVQREPRFDRAWYNLGLLLAQTNKLSESIGALRQAESLAPTSVDYPYALATVLLRAGDRPAALAAARRALAIDPNHVPSQQLLRSP